METQQINLSLTDNAVKRVTILLEQENRQDEGVRVKVTPGGCSGYKYDLNFDKPTGKDIVIDDRGIKIITDEESVAFLKGAKIEYVEDPNGYKFKLINPNETSKCECGSSVGF